MAFTHLIDAPARTPRKGGIRSVVSEFITHERLALGGPVEYIADSCKPLSRTKLGCFDDTVQEDKDDVEGILTENGIGPAFGVYAGIECGIDETGDYDERAKAKLEMGLDREVEAELWDWAIDAPDGTTAPTLAAALARAQAYADRNYLAQPVILLSTFAAAQTPGVEALTDDEPLRTRTGVPIVSTGMAPEAEELTVLIIGQPTIVQSEVVTNRVTKPQTNETLAIAEKALGIAVDCLFRYKVTVTP